MKKLAIVGTGISGIAAAHYLKHDYEIEVFEKENYSGGHTSTVVVEEGDLSFPVDTGFIIYNEKTYPNLVRLFDELGIETAPCEMTFSLWDRASGLQMGFSGLNSLLGRRRNAFSPRFWRMLRDTLRFFRESARDLEWLHPQVTLEQYLRIKGFDDSFLYDFILPMGSAIWSAPIEKMLVFPARSFLVFFGNHGLLGVNTQLPWRYLRGGSKTYNQAIRDSLPRPVRLKDPALAVRREGAGVLLRTASGEHYFDRVLLATHADETLRLLTDATEREREVLGAFQYQSNRVVLHTDESVMPPARRIWSAWNYKKAGDTDESLKTSTVYYMNVLQDLPGRKNYFVSVNDLDRIDPRQVIRGFEYTHPLFDAGSLLAQEQIAELNADGPVYFSGAYQGYGFHEDGLVSALRVVNRLRGVPDFAEI